MGINPASAALGWLEVVTILSNARGTVDVEALKAALNEHTAGMMMTNPNTLGLTESDVEQIAGLVHDAGGLRPAMAPLERHPRPGASRRTWIRRLPPQSA